MKRNGAPFLWNGCAVLAEYATVFRLEKKYNHSKEYVREIIRKKYIYPEIRKAELLSNFSNLFANESELLETIYSFSNSGESLHNRPLSKLTKDILYQLGILKENERV